MFNQRRPEALESELEAFRNFLEYRQEDLCRSEMSMISTKLETSIRTWFRTTSRFGEEDLRGCSTTSYVLDCPNLHVVPFNVLQKRMNSDGQQFQVSEVSQRWPTHINPLANFKRLCQCLILDYEANS